jgi:hypothetical protein
MMPNNFYRFKPVWCPLYLFPHNHENSSVGNNHGDFSFSGWQLLKPGNAARV